MELAIAGFLLVVGGASILAGALLTGDAVAIDGAAAGRRRRRKPVSEGTRRVVQAIVAGAVGVLIALVTWVVIGLSAFVGIAGCVLLGVIGALAPQARADRKERHRLHAADLGVADFAGLLSVELRSGVGLDAALENVAGELDGVLAEEMQTANTQVRFGMPRDRALELLRERVPAHNVERLAQALQHAGELGAPVADTLDKLGDDCTTRRFQEVREEAAKLPVKILFPVLFCIFPPMLVVLAGPAMVDIAKAF